MRLLQAVDHQDRPLLLLLNAKLGRGLYPYAVKEPGIARRLNGQLQLRIVKVNLDSIVNSFVRLQLLLPEKKNHSSCLVLEPNQFFYLSRSICV